MPFKSTLFTFENQTVLPIYERCDALGAAGKTEQIITVFILCRKLDVCITPSTLAEGEPRCMLLLRFRCAARVRVQRVLTRY